VISLYEVLEIPAMLRAAGDGFRGGNNRRLRAASAPDGDIVSVDCPHLHVAGNMDRVLLKEHRHPSCVAGTNLQYVIGLV
jgi:hypothetical protein